MDDFLLTFGYAILGLCILFYALIIATLILSIISCIYQYKILKYMRFEHPVLGAIIPFYSVYSISKVSTGNNNEVEIFGHKFDSRIVHFWWAISIGVSMIPVIGNIANVVLTIIMYCWILTNIEMIITGSDNNDVSTFRKVIYALFPFIGIIIVARFIKNKQ